MLTLKAIALGLAATLMAVGGLVATTTSDVARAARERLGLVRPAEPSVPELLADLDRQLEAKQLDAARFEAVLARAEADRAAFDLRMANKQEAAGRLRRTLLDMQPALQERTPVYVFGGCTYTLEQVARDLEQKAIALGELDREIAQDQIQRIELDRSAVTARQTLDRLHADLRGLATKRERLAHADAVQDVRLATAEVKSALDGTRMAASDMTQTIRRIESAIHFKRARAEAVLGHDSLGIRYDDPAPVERALQAVSKVVDPGSAPVAAGAGSVGVNENALGLAK